MEFYKRTKGHMSQYEDWWHLRINDEGQQVVVHSWDYVRVGTLERNDGSKTYSIAEFLAGENNEQAKSKLREVLQKQET